MERRRSRNRLAGTNLLHLVPVRIAPWEEREGRVVIIRPRPETGPLRHPLAWLSYWLAPARLKLDPLGSAAWRHLDGSRTVGQVAAAVRREFGDPCEPAEERVGSFVRLLRREHLLSFPGWDRPPVDPPAGGGLGGWC